MCHHCNALRPVSAPSAQTCDDSVYRWLQWLKARVSKLKPTSCYIIHLRLVGLCHILYSPHAELTTSTVHKCQAQKVWVSMNRSQWHTYDQYIRSQVLSVSLFCFLLTSYAALQLQVHQLTNMYCANTSRVPIQKLSSQISTYRITLYSMVTVFGLLTSRLVNVQLQRNQFLVFALPSTVAL